jgi:Xaa-Pro aminopeptidase
MGSLGFDGFLLPAPSDVSWMTDFTGHDSVLVVTPDAMTLATDFRYVEQVARECPWLAIALRENQMAETLAGVLVRSGARRIGFDANRLTFGMHRSLLGAIQSAGGGSIELVPADDVLLSLRKIKDAHEVENIRRAVGVAEEAFRRLLGQIRTGVTESALAGILEMEMRRLGASGSSFSPIVAVGASSSLPHYRASETPVRPNVPLLIDWGAVVGGYCSDLTRTLLIGDVDARIEEIYQVVLKAQSAAIRLLRPGVTTRQADSAARDVIREAGYGEQFGHGLGHGIGLEVHEMPSLRRQGADEPLQAGMIVTIEPGIYLPGVGGVRIEDDVLITVDGCEVLSSLEKSLEACRISV